MADRDDADSTPRAAEQSDMLSRRRALTAAGLLAAGAGVTPAQGASSLSSEQSSKQTVGEAQGPANAVEFRARFAQTGASGESFTGYGYLTRAAGVEDAELFAGAALNETTALLTAYASGDLARRVLDTSVHSLDIVGTLAVYQRGSPGATFADPASFQVGVKVAEFDLTLQDILTVFAPAKGIPTLTGSMRQTLAGALAGGRPRRRFGHVGSDARLFATGLGTLVDPITLNANLEMAGNWVTE